MIWMENFWGLQYDLAHIEGLAERAALRESAKRRVMRGWWHFALTLLVVAAAPRLATYVANHLSRVLPVPRFILTMLCISTIMFAYVAVLALLYRGRMRRAIRELLRARGVHVCLACGYDLRGGTGVRCPECGTLDRPDSSALVPPTSRGST